MPYFEFGCPILRDRYTQLFLRDGMSQGNYKLRAEGKEEEGDLFSGPNKKGMKIKGVGI